MSIDVAGFITYLKDHAVEHGFHVHDERHFIETYSLRQAWEVDMHPDFACDGPLDLNLAFDVEPRTLLDLDEKMADMDDEFGEPEGEWTSQLVFNWALPALQAPPELVIVSAELAGIAGTLIPIEVSAVDSFGALSNAPERRLSMVGKVDVSLVDVMLGREKLCDVLDTCRDVSEWIVDNAASWKPQDPEPEPGD
jgi:hypothetical protein